MKDNKNIKVSIVVTARNDDHGGGFLRRMQVFANALIAQCDRHKLKAELIVIEWNTMPDRPGLSEVLEWPEKSDFCSVRFIEVPPEIHNQYTYSSNLGLYQMIAKNVGFRRSRADYFLATNIDILISDELMKFMASDNLRENVLYRVDRYDIPEDIPLDATVEEQLEYCRNNLTRNNERDGTRNFMTGKYFPTYVGLYTDSTRLHFNACGDFTLMHRNDWYALRGYPEFDMYSAHMDSVMLLMAYNAGIRQEILPDEMQTYHIEHSSSMIAEKAGKLFKDLKSAGVPQIKVPQIEDWAREMNRAGRPLLFNGPDWGHATEELIDTYVIRAAWDRDGNGAHTSESESIVNPVYMSVIVSGGSTPGSVRKCLDSMASQSLSASEFEVLAILDEDSASHELIEQYRDRIDLRIIHPANDRYSASYAAGITGAKGHVVLFMNHDSIADTNMLHEHWLFHKNNPPGNKDIWAHLNIEYPVMIGHRTWDRNLKLTPLMQLSLKDDKDIKADDIIRWWHFKCDNLSCNRDFIVRYGNFDETFNANSDLEIGYRLSKRKMKIVYSDRARSYLTTPFTIINLKETAYAEGQFAFRLITKYSDPEVQEWSRLSNARDSISDLKESIAADLKKLENSSEVNDGLKNCYDHVYAYHRAKGLIDAESDKLNIIKEVFMAKLYEKARNPDEKTILIISETLPLYDLYSDDSDLYNIIKILARNHSVTFLSRKGVEKGKYIEVLRKIGVSVFYDGQGLNEQVLVESKSFCHASNVSIQELLIHRNYDLILFHGSNVGNKYINPVRDFSSQSVVMIRVSDTGLSPETGSTDTFQVYDEADVILASQKAAEIISSSLPGMIVKPLPDTKDTDRLENALNALMSNLPVPQSKHVEKFRIFPEMVSDSAFCKSTNEVTVIFVCDNNSDTSIQSLDSLLKYSNPEVSNIVVAVNDKRCDGIGDKLESEQRYYFTYSNKNELDTYISKILTHSPGEYISVVEGSVIVCPQWDMRLMSHLKKDTQISVITAKPSEFFYNSLYDFEDDAYTLFVSKRGKNKVSSRINTPCLIVRRSICPGNQFSDLSELMGSMLADKKVAEAQDTLVFSFRKGLKKKKTKILDQTVSKKLSVIISAFNNGKKLFTCLDSLFHQKCINYDDIEIIVIYTGADKREGDLLNGRGAPCTYKYIMKKGMGIAASLNHGIKTAKGEHVLFISQEAIADENVISEHIKTHIKHKHRDIAVLGHISLSGMNDSAPFIQYLSKNPKLPFASPYVYNFTDISNPENAGHFYLSNISVNRQIFQKVGIFNEDMPDEWVGLDFGLRLSLKRYKVTYKQNALVINNTDIDLNRYLKEQTSAGKQFAVMAYKHPGVWNIKGAKMQCMYFYYGKQALFNRVREIAGELECMGDELRSNYKYAGVSLLDKSFYILANYCFAEGINEVICRVEGDDWLSTYIRDNDIDSENIINENKAFEKLFESYWHIGRGDYETFSRFIEQSSAMMEGHPSAYYAAGNYYFNLSEYKLAEATFQEGIEKRRSYHEDSVFPGEDETLFAIWIAMSCIPEGKYTKAATVLEELIAERLHMSEEQEAMIYRCLDLSYRGLGDLKRSAFCRQEADRLNEIIKSKQELQSLERVSI